LAEGVGTPIGGVDKKIRSTKSFQKGLTQGILKRTENNALFQRVLASKGIFESEQQQPLPADLEPLISGPSPDTELNVLNEISQPEAAPQAFVQPPQRTALQMGGGQRVTIAGRQYNVPAAAKKTEKAGTMKFTLPGGEEAELNLPPETVRELLARRLASPDKEAGINDDIDAALKKLKTLNARSGDEVNVFRDKNGNIDVRPDEMGFTSESSGLTAQEAVAQLEGERMRRNQMPGTPSTGKPKNRAEAAAQQIKRFTLEQAMGTLPRRPAPLAAPVN
jgi:hypothetical protein